MSYTAYDIVILTALFTGNLVILRSAFVVFEGLLGLSSA